MPFGGHIGFCKILLYLQKPISYVSCIYNRICMYYIKPPSPQNKMKCMLYKYSNSLIL